MSFCANCSGNPGGTRHNLGSFVSEELVGTNRLRTLGHQEKEGKFLLEAVHHGSLSEASSLPSVFKWWLRLNKKLPFLSGADGWLVNSNKNKVRYADIYKEATRPFTNHPACAVKERELFIEAQPPLLENGGEWTRLATNPFLPPRVATGWTVLNRYKWMIAAKAAPPYQEAALPERISQNGAAKEDLRFELSFQA